MSDIVTYERAGSVAEITMDDGKVNCLSPVLLRELNAAFDQAAGDGATVLLTGRPGRFSAGFDLTVLRAGGESAAEMLNAGFTLTERIVAFPTPVVIACSGHAIAMGSFLLASADVRIGADGPFKIAANEVALGLTIPRSSAVICRERLAPAFLHRALVTAEVFGPAGAVAAGFLDRVVPEADLLPAAREAATTLSQLDLDAYAATKLRIHGDMLRTLRVAIEADDAAARAH